MADFYRVVRVRPNGTEQVVKDIPYTDVTDEQLIRAQAFVDGEARKASGLHIRLYSSSEGLVGPGDIIWDSAVNL